MRLLCVFFSIFVMLIGSKTLAKLDSAPFAVLVSADETSVIEMTCRGEKPFRSMRCKFSQKSLRKNVDAVKKAEEALAKWKADESEKAVKGALKSCSEKSDFVEGSNKTEGGKAFGTEQNRNRAEACECLKKSKSIDCIKAIIKAEASREERTCKFSINNFEMDLKQISDNKWMNTPEPAGLCNNVNAITIEFDGKYGWKFTQTRLSSDEGPLCGFDVNKPTVYDSKYSGKFKVDCTYVDLESVL